jgi:hypothetical protein
MCSFFISSLSEGHIFRLLTHSLFFLKSCVIQTLELLMWRLLTLHVTNWRLRCKFSSASQDIWCLLAAQNIYQAWSQLMKIIPKTLLVHNTQGRSYCFGVSMQSLSCLFKTCRHHLNRQGSTRGRYISKYFAFTQIYVL